MPPVTLRKPVLDQKISEAGGPAPKNVLAVCGDMIRRSSHPDSARTEETERALRALSPAHVALALGALDVAQIQRETARAIEESFEAAFADTPEERAMFAASAMSALKGRDQLESVLAAARAHVSMSEVLGGASVDAVRGAVDALEQAAASLDRQLSARVRSLTAVNPERRAELAKLDESARSRAWWYSARADEGDDDLLVALADLPGGDASVTHLGSAAQADIGGSALLTLDRAAEDATLRRAAQGTTTATERAWLSARAAADASLAADVALAVDRSIDEGE